MLRPQSPAFVTLAHTGERDREEMQRDLEGGLWGLNLGLPGPSLKAQNFLPRHRGRTIGLNIPVVAFERIKNNNSRLPDFLQRSGRSESGRAEQQYFININGSNYTPSHCSSEMLLFSH